MFDIPGYTISSKLAEGAHSEILLAVQQRSGRLVVIKTLHPRHAGCRRESQRIQREGTLLRQLQHDHIVALQDSGATTKSPFLVLEYIQGATLRAVLAKRKMLNNLEVLRLADALGAALQALHQAGYCHKDIKPDNVLVDANGALKLTDFGFARRLTWFSQLAGRFRRREGSPAYMAPEMLMRNKVSFATDIYALGCTLYEAAAGTPPFHGMSESEVIRRQANPKLAAQPLTLFNADISPATAQLILKALEKDPKKRFAAINDFLVELESNPLWAEGQQTRIRVE